MYLIVIPVIGLASREGIPWQLRPVFAGLIVLGAWLWLRLPFTGVTVSHDALVVTSWFSRRVFAKGKIARFRSVPYEGTFYYLAWTIDYGRFASGVLSIESDDGSHAVLNGTVTSATRSREMAEALNRWIGSEVGDGAGSRRQASARRRDRPPRTIPGSGKR